MGEVTRPHVYSDGAVARPDFANENETILYNVLTENLDWANLNEVALANKAQGLVKLDADAKVPVAQLPTTIPSGVIVMWSGTLATIPTGWSLCDGAGGTPDLRDKFVMGAPAATDPGGTGGSTSHSHTVASHSHTIGSHAHTVNSHIHTIGSHSHTMSSHYHTVSSHSHSGGSLEFHRSITLVGRASSGGDCIALTDGTTSWGLRPDNWYGSTGGAAPNTNSKSPGMSSVAPSCGGATPGMSSVAPSCSSESPGTDSKEHLPPHYEIAFIMKD